MPGIEGFELPQKVDVEISDVNEFGVPLKATFTTEPWAHGFGNTIGNALRRVLLSSMEGVAVSSILIPKVAHEFSSIPDVLEDVMDIILNIKKLKFTCDGETPHSVELYADKAGPVTGANIREDGIVTVLNKDQIICTLDTDRQFEMHLELDRGKGYRPSELNKRDDQPIGTIPVDCLFSPIERVSYDVQACRVGSNTDYDRLELTVWADGRIDPRDAVKKAARILTDHLSVFIGDAKAEAPRWTSPNSMRKALIKSKSCAKESIPSSSPFAPSTFSKRCRSSISSNSLRSPNPNCSNIGTAARKPFRKSNRNCRTSTSASV